jgi:tetratricopeptide (TPR) repeat protein
MTGVMMSVETIRMALARLQDDPENEAAWNELAEAVTAPEASVSNADIERLLGSARARHEQRREWAPVARLLELEIAFAAGTPVEAPMQAELARIYQDELVDAQKALAAYKRLLALRPDDATAEEAIENDEAKRAKWSELVARYASEGASGDESFASSLYASAADVGVRYGGPDARDAAIEHMEKALALDPKNRRAAALAEIVYTQAKDWANVARIQTVVLAEGGAKDERVAAGLRLGRTASKKLGDDARATLAYQKVLELSPGQPDAMSFLAESFSANEQWDELAALYEDQLRGGGVRHGEELGILVQISMVHWRMRGQPDAAEPYFERVRRADPTHAGMLNFFREWCTAKNDKARLSAILTDAQRAMADGPDKRALATEIARLAESQENATKAIEQYKTVLRADPDNRDARDALKRLYAHTESWNALVELLRQELERTPHGDAAARVAVLREIAAIYRDRAKNDAALVTVLTQIVQLDEHDTDAVRELTRVYEGLGRWRDLLAYQQKLAELIAGQESRRPISTAPRRGAGSSSSPTCRTRSRPTRRCSRSIRTTRRRRAS